MKKEYITPAISVIQMDDVCVNNASVMDRDNRTFDNFRVNRKFICMKRKGAGMLTIVPPNP